MPNSLPTVAVLVGSLRAGSVNRQLARALAAQAADRLAFSFVEIGDLPLYNDDLWTGAGGPAPVERVKAQVAAADAVLLVTPEYNRAVPGLLANALDWGSRPADRGSWAGKPAACCGASPGAIGTAAAQVHLKAQMVTLGMIPMGRPEVYLSLRPENFDPDGHLADDKTRDFLDAFIAVFAAHVARFADG